MVWKASKSGEFSMKSFYSTLELENEVLAPSKLVWGSWAPSKVGFFFMGSSLGKDSHHGKRLGQGFSPQTSLEGEDVFRRLLLCLKMQKNKKTIYSSIVGKQRTLTLIVLLSWHFVLPYLVRNLLQGWYGSFVGKKRRKAWRVTPFCLFQTIWKECDPRTFEGVQCTSQSLKNSRISNPYMWSQGYLIVDGQASPLSVIDFIE